MINTRKGPKKKPQTDNTESRPMINTRRADRPSPFKNVSSETSQGVSQDTAQPTPINTRRRDRPSPFSNTSSESTQEVSQQVSPAQAPLINTRRPERQPRPSESTQEVSQDTAQPTPINTRRRDRPSPFKNAPSESTQEVQQQASPAQSPLINTRRPERQPSESTQEAQQEQPTSINTKRRDRQSPFQDSANELAQAVSSNRNTAPRSSIASRRRARETPVQNSPSEQTQALQQQDTNNDSITQADTSINPRRERRRAPTRDINHDANFNTLLENNKELLQISHEFHENMYQPIMGEKDDRTSIIEAKTKGGIAKLEKKEFTITVVGEVKAGKSTLINALVGYDISHARTKAATTFPLRIKHVPNHGTGVDFNFNPSDKFWALVNKTQQELRTNNSRELGEFRNTVKFIKDGQFTSSSYNVRSRSIDEIRSLLECLHDFPRVYGALFKGLEEEVMDLVEELPEVVLEFPTIQNLADLPADGSIILIDTPGLGEKGSIDSILQRLVKKEIAESSAVMAVLEKGGKNSNNEGKIKKLISACNAPAYIIAGKMDDYNRDGKDTPIKTLLNGIQQTYSHINGDFEVKVFAVSQQDAVIGVNAINSIRTTGSLPNPYNDSSIRNPKDHWVKDMITNRYSGRKAKDYISRRRGYEDLLKESDGEYDEIIRDEYLKEEDPNLSFLKLIGEFKKISKTADKLIIRFGKEKLTANLSDQVDIIEELQKQCSVKSETIGDALVQIEPLMQQVTALSQDVQQTTNKHKGVITETGTEVKQAIVEDVKEFMEDGVSPLSNDELKEIFETDILDEFMTFEFNSIEATLHAITEMIQTDNGTLVTVIQKIVQDLKDVMKDNFDISLKLPHFSDESLQAAGFSMNMNEFEETETYYKEHTRLVERDGFGGGAARFFGGIFGQDDWGYDEETYYTEHTKNVFKRKNFLLRLSEQLRGALEKVVFDFDYKSQRKMESITQLQQSLDSELTQKKFELEKIMNDKQKDSSMLEERIIRMQQMVSQLQTMQQDVEAITVPTIQ